MKSLPELGMTATADGEADGEKIDFEGGLTVLNDRAYVGYDGNQYEVDPTTFGFIKSGFEKTEQEGEGESKGAEANACQKAATSLDLSEFVDNLENEGGEEVDGVKTTKLSGDLNPQKRGRRGRSSWPKPRPAPRSSKPPARCRSASSKKYEGEFTEAIKKAHADIYVGEDDHIVRKVVADLTIEPKGSGEKTETSARSHAQQGERKGVDQGPGGRQTADRPVRRTRDQPDPALGLLEGGGTEGLGGLLEGIIGGSGSAAKALPAAANRRPASGAEEAELPLSPEFTECLEEAEGRGGTPEVRIVDGIAA